MSHLAERKLVALAGDASGKWAFAKITDGGIEIVENKERYGGKFPFSQAASGIQEKSFRTEQSQVSFPEQLSNAFKQANNQVLGTKISPGEKGKIEKQLKSLGKELLKTTKADLGAIQKDWQWLNKNAGWVCPALASVVLEGIRVALDLPISSKP